MASSAAPFDEEREVGFQSFYPMTLREVINGKYMVVAKFGFGSSSTIWCCRDLVTMTYTALKIYAHDAEHAASEIDIETAIHHLRNEGNPRHPGKMLLRTIQDYFLVKSRAGNVHHCVVYDVLSNDIFSLRHTRLDGKLPEVMVKRILINLLHALDFLHRECHIIHTDIKEKDILLSFTDPSILELLDMEEIMASSLRKSVNGYNLYKSVNFGIPLIFGSPILSDFSRARDGELDYSNSIQQDPYRAPEVILEMPWGYAVDIWNVGVMVWDMLENRRLFDVIDPETGEYGDRFHLASIVGLLGPPSLEFLQRSKCSSNYFDDRGNWKCLNPVLPVSWEDSEGNLEVSNKRDFLNFIRRMVSWTPESRASPSELLQDPWLRG